MKIVLKNPEELLILIMKSGQSIRGFSKKAGVSHPHIVAITKGYRNPGPRTAKKISDAVNKQFDEIFFIENGCKSDQSA